MTAHSQLRRLLPLLVLVAVLVVAGCGGKTAPVVVKAHATKKLGRFLVTGAGMTLYTMKGESAELTKCLDACVKLWHPLTVHGSQKPIAGPGVTASKLGTLERPDGKVQVTYNGLGLYEFGKDQKAGDANSQGMGGLWFTVTPAGQSTENANGVGECAPGQHIPEGAVGDDDDDNTVDGPSDGDGCI